MKRIFALIICVAMLLSVGILAGCNNDETPEEVVNLYADLEDFDSYVSKDATILGRWQENLEDEDRVVSFFETTTMHITDTFDDVSTTTVCTYNFNDETGELSYYMLSDKKTCTYKVSFEAETMTWTSDDGETRTFKKIG